MMVQMRSPVRHAVRYLFLTPPLSLMLFQISRLKNIEAKHLKSLDRERVRFYFISLSKRNFTSLLGKTTNEYI